MAITGSAALVIGASLSALAALAHIACVVVGGPAYRLLGAGERMARAAEAVFPENSNTFWLVSSGICLLIGLIHLYGLVMVWPAL